MDLSCLIAAACFITGGALSVTLHVREKNREHFDYAQFTMLQPDYIQKDWAFRRENQSIGLASGFINAFAWIFLSIPMIQSAVILSRGGTRKLSVHIFIGVLVVAGCVMEFLARFMSLGQENWGVWLSQEYNLQNWASATSNDNIGWRTLEVSHLINYGTVIWIDSFEYLCLGFALLLFYASVNSLPLDGPMITRSLAGFGLFIGLFSLADFVAGILRLKDWSTFRMLSMIISVINRLVLLPLFLLILGMQLPRAVREHKEQVVPSAGSPGSASRSRHWVDSASRPPLDNVEMVSQGD